MHNNVENMRGQSLSLWAVLKIKYFLFRFKCESISNFISFYEFLYTCFYLYFDLIIADF